MAQEGFVLISVCLHPRSRGYVRIRNTDPAKSPEIDPSYLSDAFDINCLIDSESIRNNQPTSTCILLFLAIKQGAALIDTEPFKALGAQLHWPSFPECADSRGTHNRAYMECLVRMASLTMYHPSGTSAMGKTDDHRAVLDTRLR